MTEEKKASKIHDLFTDSLERYQEKLKRVENIIFDNSEFVDGKNQEIEEIKKSIDHKEIKQERIMEQEIQLLNVELNKDLSKSNEILYNTNTALDKNLSDYQQKVEAEDIDFQAKLKIIKDEQVQKTKHQEKLNSEEIVKISQEINQVTTDFQEKKELLIKDYKKSIQALEEEIVKIQEAYYDKQEELLENFKKENIEIEAKREQTHELLKQLQQLDKKFQSTKTSYDKKIDNATNKDENNRLKKELNGKVKEYDANAKLLRINIENINRSVDNELNRAKNILEQKNSNLQLQLLQDLNNQEENIRNLNYRHNYELDKLTLTSKTSINSLEERQRVEEIKNKYLLEILEQEYQIKDLTLVTEHQIKLANLESQKDKLELETLKIKTEQTTFRNICKIKMEFNSEICKVKNQFALKNAQTEEVKIIQKHKSEISVDNTNLNFSKIKENYLIVNNFTNIPYTATTIQNEEKIKHFSNSRDIEKILKDKLEKYLKQIDNLITLNQNEYQDIIENIKEVERAQALQLNKVLQLAKETQIQNLIDYTNENIASINKINNEKKQCISDNYNFVNDCYLQLKKTLEERYQNEIIEFNAVAARIGSSLNDLKSSLQTLSEKEERSYTTYLDTFENHLNNKIVDINNTNTMEIERYNLSIEENNKILKGEIDALVLKQNQTIAELEKENIIQVNEVEKKLKNIEQDLNNKIKKINNKNNDQLNNLKSKLDNAEKENNKCQMLLERYLKENEDNLIRETKNLSNQLSANLAKSAKIKVKTIKAKKDSIKIVPDTKWWIDDEN